MLSSRGLIGLGMVTLIAVASMFTSLTSAQQEAPEPAPPADQTYLGAKKCASCHFDQYVSWRKTKHAKSFELLPAKYQADAKCVKCHSTGFGEPTGFKSVTATPDLVGTSCEQCHGPGSAHAEICKPFTGQKPTAAQEKLARDSIWKILPKNICISCHMVQGHHESLTPPELRKK